jgi:hypothetical protein
VFPVFEPVEGQRVRDIAVPVLRPARVAVIAAVVTLTAAIALDLAAGQRLMHTVPLAAAATFVGVLRVRLVGQYRGVFTALSGAIVAQPALHLVTSAAPLASAGDVDVGHLVGSDVPVTVGHVLLTALIVGGVMCAEQILLLLAAFLRGTTWWFLPPSPPCIARSATPLTRCEIRPLQVWVDHVARRGPPPRPLSIHPARTGG